MTEKLLQWHPAFFAGIQIELEEDADCLELTQEYSLGTKPMAIDEKSLLLRRDISTHSVQQCPLHCVQCFQYLICCINISKFPFQQTIEQKADIASHEIGFYPVFSSDVYRFCFEFCFHELKVFFDFSTLFIDLYDLRNITFRVCDHCILKNFGF